MAGTLQSSGSLSVAVAVSRVLGLVRESLKARLIGAGALADTYAVAFRIPNLLRDLLAEGALSSAFVPTFTASLVQEDRDRAHRLADLALADRYVGLVLDGRGRSLAATDPDLLGAPAPFPAMAAAIASGGRRRGRASLRARFEARSPWLGFVGRSTSTRGGPLPSGSRGRAPEAMAAR